MDILNRSQAWLHGTAPVDSLALYRIGFFFLVMLHGLWWLPHTTELFSVEGFHIPRFGLLFFPPLSIDQAFYADLFVVVFAFLSMIGFMTRLSILCLTFFWSVLYLVDTLNEKAIVSVMLVVMVMLLLSRSHYRYSVDAWLRRWWAKPYPREVSVFPLRLIQFEFAQIYFFCGLTKLMDPKWPTGEVFLKSIEGRWANDFGIWISGWVPDMAVRAMGFGTILFELFVPFMLFMPRARYIAMVLCVSFHLGIESMMDIGFLGRHFILAVSVLFWAPEAVASLMDVCASRAFPIGARLRAWFYSPGQSRVPVNS